MSKIGIETQIKGLSNLLEELKQGRLQVPPFQRDFVWDRDAIKNLFDSIKNNYPIGSILLWKPKDEINWKEPNKEVGGFKLPDTFPGYSSYVLDGYQRLSALFGCLTNPKKVDLKVNSHSRDNYFDLFYDLEEDNFVYIRHLYPKPYQVPVYVLMSTSEFRQYSRKNLENNPDISSDKIDLYLDRADAFARSLLDYKLAVIEIYNATLSDAVNIFSRINSKGTDISYDWMVNALSYDHDFNFSLEIDNLKYNLTKYHFQNIPRNILFRCYQSAFDDKLYIDQTKIEELAVRKDFKETVKIVTPCIEKAVRFLFEELNVVSHKLMPYGLQLVFLAIFFKEMPKPSEKNKNDLKRWFWITTYSNYFTIYSLANQRKAFKKFLDYLRGETSEIIYMDDKNIPFRTARFPEYIKLATVRSKALILFQLHHYKQATGRRPSKEGLSIKKIYNSYGNLAENIVPTYNVKSLEEDLKKLFSSEYTPNYSYILPNLNILPVLNKSEEMEYLRLRKSFLQKDEMAFVKMLGMVYEM